MRRWMVNLSNLALVLVIPVLGWIEYLDYGAKRHWFDYYKRAHGLWSEPERSWIVVGILLAIAILGLNRATPRWSWLDKGLLTFGLVILLLCTFFVFSCAAVITGSKMP